MISFLRGTIQDILPFSVIIEVNNIGYEVLVSTNTLINVTCFKEITLHTYLNVREDELTLFGFLTKDELVMFKLLIKVNGVGPKAALSILSTLNTNDLRYAILTGDSNKISKAKGIGKKTSERILIDLKDKVSNQDLFDTIAAPCVNYYNPEDTKIELMKVEVIEALVSLGYAVKTAKSVTEEVSFTNEMNVELFLKEALKRMR
jgi:Holliday junction DNA helicase RuvA